MAIKVEKQTFWWLVFFAPREKRVSMKWLVFFPTSSRRTHFFLQSSVFVEKKKQKKNFREKHPSNRDRPRQTDRTRRKRRRAGRGAEWRPTMRKTKQTKPPKRDDDFEKNDREKKQHTKTLVGVWYTCTTKTVKVPNKKLATKRKRRVKVVLLEIVVIFVVVILFFLCACDEVMSTT
jgi:hypothetical protein